VVQEEPQSPLVHDLGLAERERLADEPAQALPERVVEALNVVSLAAALISERGRPLDLSTGMDSAGTF